MNRRVYQIVADKRAAQEPPEPEEDAFIKEKGFRGWHSRGYLPHYDHPGTMQLITYRLCDAMPASRRREWEALLTIEDEREKRIKLEDYLDHGYGECYLRDARIAQMIEENWLHFDAQRYRLVAWVVMPNHVHVLFEAWDVPVPKVLKSWKGYSAMMANRILGRAGVFWQQDYWDRYIRDERHFNKAVRYVESNPMKAFLAKEPQEWTFSSAHPKWRWENDGVHTRYYGARLIHEVRNQESKKPQ